MHTDTTEASHITEERVPTTVTIVAPWGPWVANVDAIERQCQLRCLCGLVAVYRGSADPLIDVLRDAEVDHTVLQRAAVLFDSLPSLTARRIVSTFGAVNYRRGVAP